MKFLKIVGISILSLIVVLFMATALVIRLVPAFGSPPDEDKKITYQSSNHFNEDQFINTLPTSLDMSFASVRSVLADYLNGIPDQQPDKLITVDNTPLDKIINPADSITQLIWFGHSAFLMQTQGVNILLDPMLGSSPSPFPSLGSKRFTNGLPIEIDELPVIDIVIFSHDHYDHLDYPTLKKLSHKIKHLVVPLGVESHLLSWGFSADRITTMDWWQSTKLSGIEIISTPSRHFSGRALSDRNSTLWSSWVINSSTAKVYFSGDGGYGPHFEEIGEKLGPFDMALMECGQYDERWKMIHMMPEETVQAAKDVQAEVFIPIHWGTFVLALHSWYDPVERANSEAVRLEMPMTVPTIGQLIQIPSKKYPSKEWWTAYK